MKANRGHFIVGGLLLVAAFAAHAQDSMLLIAAPGTQGVYSRTTLVVMPASGGHVGVILNRSSDLKLASVLPGNPLSANVTAPVRFGGPLGSRVVYAMVRTDPGEGAKRVFGDVYMTTGAKTLDRIVEHMPKEVRFFSGMVVWLPGELESQIESGEWIVTQPDASLVFHKNPDAMWGELIARVGKDSAQIAARQ